MNICKICQSSEVVSVAQLTPKHGGACSALRCQRCGFLWADPLPEFTPEFLNQIYGEVYTEDIRSLEGSPESHRILYNATVAQLDILAQFLPNPFVSKRALNIGAMTIASKVLMDQGWNLTAVEVSEYAARSAEEKWGMHVLRGKIEDVPLPADMYELIKLSHVIEHLPDPLLVLRKLYSSMRAGGILLLETDNSEGLKTSLEVMVRRMIGESIAAKIVNRLTKKNLRTRYGRLIPYEHISLFNRRNITLALRDTGFKLLHLLCPAQGDPIWFPFTNQTQRWTTLEQLMSQVDRLGSKIGRGEVMILVACKA